MNQLIDYVKGMVIKMEKLKYEIPIVESNDIEILTTQLLETTAKLMEANALLQKAEKERNIMLANISHDLRAPITAIRASIDFLTSGHSVSQEDFSSSLQLIDRRTKNLENLIHDIYLLFCVEDQSKLLYYTDLSATLFLQEYYYDAILDNIYNNHNMYIDVPDNLNCNIHIDIQKFTRVLDNLLINAAKYSAKGADITLSACLNNTNDHLLISVSDTGIGIPGEAIDKIFERTYTVSSARSPESPTGSGLGLSIAKAIVERHNGSIHCKSKEGVGSVFTITLPISLTLK